MLLNLYPGKDTKAAPAKRVRKPGGRALRTVPLLRSAWRQQGRIIGVGCRAVHIFDAQHSRCGNTTRSAFAGNT